MNKNLLVRIAGGALLLIGAAFAWNQVKLSQDEGKAGGWIEEGESFLAQAEGKSGPAARDLRVKAARKAEESLALVPDFLPALLLLGRAQSALGEAAKACQTYEKILELDPDHPQALREAGVAYFERWRLSKDHAHRVEAEKNLDRALSFEPDSVRALFHLGWLLHEAGEAEKRDAIWGKLEKSAPDSQEATRAAALRSNPGGE